MRWWLDYPSDGVSHNITMTPLFIPCMHSTPPTPHDLPVLPRINALHLYINAILLFLYIKTHVFLVLMLFSFEWVSNRRKWFTCRSYLICHLTVYYFWTLKIGIILFSIKWSINNDRVNWNFVNFIWVELFFAYNSVNYSYSWYSTTF